MDFGIDMMELSLILLGLCAVAAAVCIGYIIKRIRENRKKGK